MNSNAKQRHTFFLQLSDFQLTTSEKENIAENHLTKFTIIPIDFQHDNLIEANLGNPFIESNVISKALPLQ